MTNKTYNAKYVVGALLELNNRMVKIKSIEGSMYVLQPVFYNKHGQITESKKPAFKGICSLIERKYWCFGWMQELPPPILW